MKDYKCPNCGEMFSRKERFCPKCGEKPRQKLPVYIPLIILIFLVGIGYFAFSFGIPLIKSNKAYNLAVGYEEQQQYDLAIQSYSEVIELDKKHYADACNKIIILNSTVFFLNANEFEKEGNYESALELYALVSEQDTEHFAVATERTNIINSQLAYNTALTYEEAEDYESAREWYLKVDSSDAELYEQATTKALVMESRLLMSQAKAFEDELCYEEAVDCYRKVNKSDGDIHREATIKMVDLARKIRIGRFIAKCVVALQNSFQCKSIEELSAIAVDGNNYNTMSCRIQGCGYIIQDTETFTMVDYLNDNVQDEASGNYSSSAFDALTGLYIMKYKPSIPILGVFTAAAMQLKETTSEYAFIYDSSSTKTKDVNVELANKYLKEYENSHDLEVLGPYEMQRGS